MRQTRRGAGERIRRLAAAGLVAGLGLAAPGRAVALGPDAPPTVSFASVLTEGTSIVARVRIVVPGGRVPDDLTVVEVTRPDLGSRTLALERTDFRPEGTYAAVVGSTNDSMASGLYRLSITDRAGGSTLVDLGFSQPLPLAAPGNLKVKDSLFLPTSPARVLDLGVNPAPIVSFEVVPGAGLQQVVVQEALSDLEVFRGTVSGAPDEEDRLSLALPGGIMVPGRRYLVTVEAFDAPSGLGCTVQPGCVQADARTHSSATLELITRGPEIELTVSGGAATGQALIVVAQVSNPGPALLASAEAWIGLPGGGVVPLPPVEVAVPSGLGGPVLSGPVLSHTFGAADPPGAYVIGVRLRDPATGFPLAQVVRTIQR